MCKSNCIHKINEVLTGIQKKCLPFQEFLLHKILTFQRKVFSFLIN